MDDMNETRLEGRNNNTTVVLAVLAGLLLLGLLYLAFAGGDDSNLDTVPTGDTFEVDVNQPVDTFPGDMMDDSNMNGMMDDDMMMEDGMEVETNSDTNL